MSVTAKLTVNGGTISVAACEHVWGEWEITTEATCVDAGEKTRTCSGGYLLLAIFTISGEISTAVREPTFLAR